MKTILKKISSGIRTLLLISFTLLIISLVLGLPLMLLWNWLIPVIFGLNKITFLQAVGLNFLSSIIFKNNESNKNEK